MTPKRLLYTMDEAAEMLGISVRTLVSHVTAGDLRYVRIGKRTRKFTERDIQDFIEARRQCQSIVRKTARTGTLTLLSREPGFMEARAQRLNAQPKQPKQG